MIHKTKGHVPFASNSSKSDREVFSFGAQGMCAQIDINRSWRSFELRGKGEVSGNCLRVSPPAANCASASCVSLSVKLQQ